MSVLRVVYKPIETRMSGSEIDMLMARLAAGDRSAFGPVFELLWPSLRRFCQSLLRNDADAADAAQEALYKIFERASDYDRTRPAMPWALAIAGWECRTIARRRHRRRETREETSLDQEQPVDLEANMIQRELATAAVAALGELSDADRAALVSRFWDEATSVSGATFRKRRERALDRLRRTLSRIYALD